MPRVLRRCRQGARLATTHLPISRTGDPRALGDESQDLLVALTWSGGRPSGAGRSAACGGGLRRAARVVGSLSLLAVARRLAVSRTRFIAPSTLALGPRQGGAQAGVETRPWWRHRRAKQ